MHDNIPHARVYQLKGNGQGVFGIVGDGNILQKGMDQANTLGKEIDNGGVYGKNAAFRIT